VENEKNKNKSNVFQMIIKT